MGQRAVHAKGGIRMIIVSQNKERVLWFGRAFNALEYNEDISKKGKQETVRHTICISDGCLEEIAEYDSKERCLAVLKDFCGTYEEECYTNEFFNQSAQAQRPATYRKNIVYQFPEK